MPRQLPLRDIDCAAPVLSGVNLYVGTRHSPHPLLETRKHLEDCFPVRGLEMEQAIILSLRELIVGDGRSLTPSALNSASGQCIFASLLISFRPASCPGAVADRVFERRGLAALFVPHKGFGCLELEFLQFLLIVPVLPRSPIDSSPSSCPLRSLAVDFESPDSCCDAAASVPSSCPSTRRRLDSRGNPC